MRITNRMIVEDSIAKMSASMERLYDLQKKASTGKKYLNASDDPSNASAVFTLKSTLQISQVYETTAQNSNDWMEASDFAMQHASDLAQKGISAALKGLSDTLGPEGRKTLAAEIDGLLKEAVDVANTKHLDRYIFSGFTTNQKPYMVIQDDLVDSNKITGIEYKGINIKYPPQTAPLFQPIHRDVGPGESITVNTDGYTAFRKLLQTLINVRDALQNNQTVAQSTSNASFSGNLDADTPYPMTMNVNLSGMFSRTAVAGSSFDSTIEVRNDGGVLVPVTLSFTKTANLNEWTYSRSTADTSGVVITPPDPGALTFNDDGTFSSNTSGIQLGANPITLNFSAVSLGYANSISGVADGDGTLDVNMGVYDSQGDLKSFMVRFSRTLTPTVWDWEPAPPNTFGAVVVDGLGVPLPSGSVTFNASGDFVSSTGNLNVPGSPDAISPTFVNMDFSGLTQKSTPNNVILSNQDGLAALRVGLADLNGALNDLTLATTTNGSRMRTLEAAQERITKSNTEFTALLSQKEEVNMAEVSALLKNQENIYQTVVTIASRTQSMMNLFDSLR